jgi:hypothetical protein
MKTSNLALRLEQEEMDASPPETPRTACAGPTDDAPAPRIAPRLRPLEFRAIVIRDQGLPQFRVR